ncbi:MAG: CHAD domain-containing protein [Eggerthellaceae bacterium]|nr:CHAD domain-containing protein [Eggerthellaceae bacterium]
MASIVVLVRHGKAQARIAGVDDFTRSLTEAGKRALVATLPDSLAPLGTMPEYLYGTTEVWSSDAHRAMETAEEVAYVLGVSEIQVHRCLFAQHFDAFMRDVHESAADVVVAIGHNPFVELTAAKLCGGSVPFKTASLGIFDIRDYDGEPYDGTLRSFSQGPRTNNWKTLVKIEHTLADAAKRVQTNMDAFLETPEDVEALHDFRVSIRTLRSELAFVEPWQRKAQNKFMQKQLRDLVVETSRLRELDVLSETVNGSDYACEELTALCDKMRRKECTKLTSVIGTKKMRKDTRKLLKKFNKIEWRDDVERFGLPEEEVASNFELMVINFEADYLGADYRNVKATHALRKNAKRVRYTSRDFANIIGEAAEGVPATMEQVQDELGALCDARVNLDLIDSMPRKKLSEEADAAIAALKQEQLDTIETILLANEVDEEEAPIDDLDTDVIIDVDDETSFSEPAELAEEQAEEAAEEEAEANAEPVDLSFAEPELVADDDIIDPGIIEDEINEG